MNLSFPNIIKSKLASVRRNNMRLDGVLRNDAGAIDLASIMVGVIVLGIVGGIIAAAVFAVIPWAQDNAAQQELEAVANAQSTSYAMNADSGTSAYSNKTQLVAGVEGITLQAKDSVDVFALGNTDPDKATAGEDGTGYVAVSVSATGNVYSITQASPTVTETLPAETFAIGGLELDVTEGVATLSLP